MTNVVPKPVILNRLDAQANRQLSYIPKSHFMQNICGGRGSGKSTLLINELTHPELLGGRFNDVYIFNPTATYDDKYRKLTKVKWIKVNKDLIIAKLRASGRLVAAADPEEPPAPIRYRRVRIKGGFKLQRESQHTEDKVPIEAVRAMPDIVAGDINMFYPKLTIQKMQEIMDTQKADILQFGDSVANKVLIVLDDLASDKLLKNTEFTQLVYLSRHFNVSMIVCTQAYHAIPKPIRLQMDLTTYFKIGSLKELETLYAENAQGLRYNEWISKYNSCFDRDYSYMSINTYNPPGYKFIRRFEGFV
jgi:hypothetical protein